MLKTAVMMSSDWRCALLRGMLVLSLKQWLLKVELAYFADEINLFVS
jgi:hypothetical protein